MLCRDGLVHPRGRETFGQFLWLLVAEFDAENGVGHSNRLFDRFGVPFSEADLERYWDS